MSKGLFITGTGTDVGKTFVTALIVKKLNEMGEKAGYYKAALSGADDIVHSDAGYVKRIAGINQADDTLLSYLYKNAVSPHLASKMEGHPVNLNTVSEDYKRVCGEFDYVTVEGSGGIVCPIRWDDKEHILLEDIIKKLGLNVLVIADAGLGTINAVVVTVEYLRHRGIGVKGVILNRYTGEIIQQDNIHMIEQLTQVKVLATVEPDATELDIQKKELLNLYE